MTDQEKILTLEQSNAKMFDAIIALGEQIAHFEKLIEIKEKERKEWADMCIRKQVLIEELSEKIK